MRSAWASAEALNMTLTAHGVDSRRSGAEAQPGWVLCWMHVFFTKLSTLCSLQNENTLWIINAIAAIKNK